MKASIMMVTYNHEKYISQAMESILCQRVKFDYEIIIGEDCSTDGTRKILLDYQKRYPEKVRLLLYDENIGMAENYKRTLNSCKGQYVAMLEGDDFWTSPDKLQKLIDFLDAHPKHVMVFHQVSIVDEVTGVCNNSTVPGNRTEFKIEDLIFENIVHTPSVAFRRNTLMELPDWITTLKLIDWPLWLLLSQHGPIGYIPEPMACYRLHHSNVWARLPESKRLAYSIDMLQKVHDTIAPLFKDVLKGSLFAHRYRLVEVSGNFPETFFALLFHHPVQSWRRRASIKKLVSECCH